VKRLHQLGCVLCTCGKNLSHSLDLEFFHQTAQAGPKLAGVDLSSLLCSAKGTGHYSKKIRKSRNDGFGVGGCSAKEREEGVRRLMKGRGMHPFRGPRVPLRNLGACLASSAEACPSRVSVADRDTLGGPRTLAVTVAVGPRSNRRLRTPTNWKRRFSHLWRRTWPSRLWIARVCAARNRS